MRQFVLDDANLWNDNALTDRQTDRQTANTIREDRRGKKSVEIVCRDVKGILQCAVDCDL